MDYNKNIKKHSAFIAIGVILCVVLLAGTSYALFFQVNTNSENQVVRTGKLEVTYGENKSKISILNLKRTSDEDALNDDNLSSSVSIVNTGSLPASYKLKLAKDLDKLINDKGNSAQFVNIGYVRVAAYVGEEQVLPPTNLSDIPTDGDGLFDVYTGTLGVEGTASIIIKVWLSENLPESEVGKYLYLKLNVESVVDEENTPEGSNN